MSIDKSLLEKLEKLPAEKRQEVEKFVEVLLNNKSRRLKPGCGRTGPVP
jgi:mRNA-degrading endonuclease RelE of RelBE toxin-antitoxin system